MDAASALSTEAVNIIRHQLWSHGYRPLALRTRDKVPIGQEWQKRARQDPPEVIRFLPVAHALNTGILCDGLRAIDIDVDDRALADQCEGIIIDLLGVAPVRTRANSPRRTILYRAATGEPGKRSIVGRTHTADHACKVEVLGRGQQILAFGVHPSGTVLEWPDDSPRHLDLADLPAVTEEQIFGALNALSPIVGAFEEPHEPSTGEHVAGDDVTADIALIRSALAVMPDLNGHYEHWIRIGLATHAATKGSEEGFALWDAWSRQCPEKYNQEDNRARWQGFKPTRIGSGTLFFYAKQAGWIRPQPDIGLFKERLTQEFKERLQQQAPARFPATKQSWDEMKAVQPREWVYGHFLIRRFVSVLGAPGGTGKTAYSYAIGYAVAANRALLGETVHEAGKVWLYNLEDPKDELLRRSNAAVIHHNIERHVVEERFFLDSGRDRGLVVAVLDPQGRVVATPIVDLVIEEIRRQGFILMIVDPFIRSHNLVENANDQINFALNQWSRIAEETGCAVLLVHHFRKGGGIAGDAAAFRGASALIDAVRAALALTPMSSEEADRLGIDPGKRWQYIRADNAKLNLAPPPEYTTWLRLVSVPLGNAHNFRPEDQVQTVEPWSLPSAWDGLNEAMVVRILERLQTGPGDGEQYTITRKGSGNARWAGSVITEIGALTDGQAIQILRSWTDSKLVTATRYTSPKTRKEIGGLAVDLSKFQEMRRQVASSEGAPNDC